MKTTHQENLARITAERIRQREKWGPQIHTSPKWIAILMEEVGEVAKALLEDNWQEFRAELIQVAAVALAILEEPDGPEAPQ